MINLHIAKSIDSPDLYTKLCLEASRGNIKISRKDDLALFCYTNQCVYNSDWSLATLVARGLIMNEKTKEIIALPFSKFFNLFEKKIEIPNLKFQTMEKMDGSMIICWFYAGSWHTSTKGSFNSPQAILAQELLQSLDTDYLDSQVTYLLELVGPSNKIVIPYNRDELVLLGGYSLQGSEISWDEIEEIAGNLKINTPKTYPYNSLQDMVRDAESLSRNSEGFVVLFDDGTRIKIKGSEYLAVHRLISQLSPLSLWAIMKDTPDQLDALRRELPEELWADFDDIKYLLQYRLDLIYAELEILNEKTKHLSDKELGLSLPTLDPTLRKFIFPFRKGEALQSRFRQSIFQHIRPTGNALEGYRASSSMNRISGELL